MSIFIQVVIAWGIPTEIREDIMQMIPITMTSFVSQRAWADKRFKHKQMDVLVVLSVIEPQTHRKVHRLRMLCQHVPSWKKSCPSRRLAASPYLSMAGYGITGEPRDVADFNIWELQ